MDDTETQQATPTKLVTVQDNIPLFLNRQNQALTGCTITANDITITQGKQVTVYPTTCTIAQGRVTVILGATGSGKDSFFNALLGNITIAHGQFLLNDKPVQSPPEWRIKWGQCLGIPPKNSLPITPIVMTKRPSGTVAKYLGDVPEKTLRMAGINDALTTQCKRLSKWQWVRVVLVRAVMRHAPFVALCWKHFLFLDGKQRERLRLLIQQLQRDYGFGLIVNTDDATIARTMADDVIIFNRGLMEQAGDAQTVYRHPANQFVIEQFADSPVNVFQGGLIGNSTVLLDNGLTLSVWGIGDDHANGEVVLCIRPEDFTPSPKGAFVLDILFIEHATGCKWIYGTLAQGTFKGADDADTLICVKYDTDGTVQVGDTVTLSVAQEKLWVLNAQTRQPLTRKID